MAATKQLSKKLIRANVSVNCTYVLESIPPLEARAA